MFSSLFFLAFLSIVWAAPSCRLRPSSQPQPSSLPNNGSATCNPGSSNNSSLIAASWYPGWLATSYPPSKISWNKYSIVTYSFAVTTPDVNVLDLTGSNAAALPNFVALAHQNNVMAAVSIGGWTGSSYYSSAVASAQNRTAFVQTVLNLVSTYNLDGIDFDWEYPNRPGIGCNTISPNDSANFLSFLQELRSNPAAKNLVLSAATSITPFAGADGQPMADVSQFANYLNHIEIMNYDISGQFSRPTLVGPNAPLYDSCSSVQAGSAQSAIAAWTGAKFPANQILLGVPAYGHSFHVVPSAAIAGSQLAANPQFIPNTTTSGTDQCGNPALVSDVMNFATLISSGYLTSSGTPAPGTAYSFDSCSKTPFIYNSATQLMVSYDNAQSFAAKGQFIIDQGLAGFAMWDATGDSNNILIDSITTALGVTGNAGC